MVDAPVFSIPTPQPGPVPTLGRIVLYRLSAADVTTIESQRRAAYSDLVGNPVQVGAIYPMMITRVWGSTPESAVNGQVLLDGNDSLWATSRTVGDGAGYYFWPPKV